MSYTKQNFVHGQILTAEQLNHIEEGIEKILPAIEAGSEKQLVSNAEGNLVWLDTTHGCNTEEVVILEDYALASLGNKVVTISSPWDENSKMSFYVDGEEIYPSSTSIAAGTLSYTFNLELMIIFTSKTTINIVVMPQCTFINKKLTIRSLNYVYNKIDRNFLPINSIAGEGNFSTILNYGGIGKATGSASVSANEGKASGMSTLAIGRSEAKGNYSFSAGYGTISTGYASAVFGLYNIEEDNLSTTNGNLMVVGNGDYDNELNEYVRSNAYTLDYKGNGWYQGTVESAGIILTSPDGTKYKLTVANGGTLTATAVTE